MTGWRLYLLVGAMCGVSAAVGFVAGIRLAMSAAKDALRRPLPPETTTVTPSPSAARRHRQGGVRRWWP